ncbi:MAG: hypothetical protein K9N38_11365 [Candidatus Marinimicrobia bacterium]|nr:hypothetical protein [Candidatus Neomarinimicrobiota bacterium]MCF7851512.1 hypothetical protein [Candidatus Neomarinimicrobiota bacterium]
MSGSSLISPRIISGFWTGIEVLEMSGKAADTKAVVSLSLSRTYDR